MKCIRKYFYNKKPKRDKYNYCPYCFKCIKNKKSKKDTVDYINYTICEEYTHCFYCEKLLTAMAYGPEYNAWDDPELLKII